MPPRETPLRGYRYGRSPQKNVALAARHAPLCGRIEEADLCRGEGFRRIAPPAPPRSQDRHVQGSSGPEGQDGILTAAAPCTAPGPRISSAPDDAEPVIGRAFARPVGIAGGHPG